MSAPSTELLACRKMLDDACEAIDRYGFRSDDYGGPDTLTSCIHKLGKRRDALLEALLSCVPDEWLVEINLADPPKTAKTILSKINALRDQVENNAVESLGGLRQRLEETQDKLGRMQASLTVAHGEGQRFEAERNKALAGINARDDRIQRLRADLDDSLKLADRLERERDMARNLLDAANTDLGAAQRRGRQLREALCRAFPLEMCNGNAPAMDSTRPNTMADVILRDRQQWKEQAERWKQRFEEQREYLVRLERRVETLTTNEED